MQRHTMDKPQTPDGAPRKKTVGHFPANHLGTSVVGCLKRVGKLAALQHGPLRSSKSLNQQDSLSVHKPISDRLRHGRVAGRSGGRGSHMVYASRDVAEAHSPLPELTLSTPILFATSFVSDSAREVAAATAASRPLRLTPTEASSPCRLAVTSPARLARAATEEMSALRSSRVMTSVASAFRESASLQVQGSG